MTEIVGFFKSYDNYKYIIIDDDGDDIEMFFGKSEDDKANFDDPIVKNIISFLNKRVCVFYDYKKFDIKEVSSDFKQEIQICYNNGKNGAMSMDTFLDYLLN